MPETFLTLTLKFFLLNTEQKNLIQSLCHQQATKLGKMFKISVPIEQIRSQILVHQVKIL
jgi:hypothetical protein